MGFCGVITLLCLTGLSMIAYFSYISGSEEGKPDFVEILKLGGSLILLSALLVVFVEVAFLVVSGASWLLIFILTIFKNEIFSYGTGLFISLVLINVGGGYMVWELMKEKSEIEEIRMKEKDDDEDNASSSKDDEAKGEDIPESEVEGTPEPEKVEDVTPEIKKKEDLPQEDKVKSKKKENKPKVEKKVTSKKKEEGNSDKGETSS